jgi:hypothetical protein
VGLLDLPAELLVAVGARLPDDDQLAAALTCRTLREEVFADRRAALCYKDKRMPTTPVSAFSALAKL